MHIAYFPLGLVAAALPLAAQPGVDLYSRTLPPDPNFGSSCVSRPGRVDCTARWQARFRIPPFDTFNGRRTLIEIVTTGSITTASADHGVRNDTGATRVATFDGPKMVFSIIGPGPNSVSGFRGAGFVGPFTVEPGETISSNYANPGLERTYTAPPAPTGTQFRQATLQVDLQSALTEMSFRSVGWVTERWEPSAAGRIVVEYRYQGPPSPWTDLGGETGFLQGIQPLLYGRGEGRAGNLIALVVDGAPQAAPGALVLSSQSLALPVFGGTLVPDLGVGIAVPVVADASGGFRTEAPAPATAGLTLVAQTAFVTPPMFAQPITLSNAIQFVSPGP
ncbi:MAG: hypothetical protein AAF628_21730 [Planctomycetota bacterium]